MLGSNPQNRIETYLEKNSQPVMEIEFGVIWQLGNQYESGQ